MNEAPIYERRQTGWVTIVGMVVALIVLGLVASSTDDPHVLRAFPYASLAIVVVTLLFSSMTVRVTPHHLEWWFGIRGLGRKIPLDEIESLAPIHTTIFEGWGIHLTWHGWVWNISGTSAVQVRLRSGTRFAVGSPEPAAVIAAVERARASL